MLVCFVMLIYLQGCVLVCCVVHCLVVCVYHIFLVSACESAGCTVFYVVSDSSLSKLLLSFNTPLTTSGHHAWHIQS